MRNQAALFIALSGLLCGGCMSSSETVKGGAFDAAISTLPAGATLGALQTRDDKLVITSGDDGPRYSVTTRDGRVLSRDLSAEQLRDRHPDMADALRRSTAGGAFLDATLDLPSEQDATPQSPMLQSPSAPF